MSEYHSYEEKPKQWRVSCEGCGIVDDTGIPVKRFHSQLRWKHLDGKPEPWETGVTQVQCNTCGNVRKVNEPTETTDSETRDDTGLTEWPFE